MNLTYEEIPCCAKVLKLRFLLIKNAPQGCAPRGREISRKRHRSGAESSQANSLFIYRKFLKTSGMVYNDNEIKMGMTKERRCGLRHDGGFCFLFDCTI